MLPLDGGCKVQSGHPEATIINVTQPGNMRQKSEFEKFQILVACESPGNFLSIDIKMIVVALLITKLWSFKDKKVRSLNFTEI